MKIIIKILIAIWDLLKNKYRYIILVIIYTVAIFLFGRASVQIKNIIIADSSATPIFTTEIDTAKNKKTMDSLWAEAKAFWNKKPRPVEITIVHDTIAGEPLPPDTVYVLQPIKYIATTKKDTIINGNHFKMSLAFISRIPVDPLGYFRYNITSEYTEPVIPKSWFKDRFIIYTGFGASLNNILSPSAQIGIGINLKSLF